MPNSSPRTFKINSRSAIGLEPPLHPMNTLQHPGPGQLLRRALILAGLFLAAVGTAWAWYHVNPKKFPVSYHFTILTNAPGWTYVSSPVDSGAAESLATTNLVNGVFTAAGKSPFTVFVGTWDAANSKEMSVVAHTPDICWVGQGYIPLSLGQPPSTNFVFNGTEVPFEVRAFQDASKSHVELTVWCTLVSGQVFEESSRWVPPANAGQADSRMLQASSSRDHLRSQFIRVLTDRIPGNGSKQFVRFSTSAEGNWQLALDRLQKFAPLWLQLQVTHPMMDGVASAR